MLRRKASKIEVKVEDKEELQEARKRAAAAAAPPTTTTTTTSTSALLSHFDRSTHDPSSKANRIVKLRLPDTGNYQKLLNLLSPFHKQTHHQRNTFFDGASKELSSLRAVLRLRFYENSEPLKCFVCLKAKAVLVDGISRVEEDEEELDPALGYLCLEDPNRLLDVDSRVLRRVKEEFGVEGFVGLGGFRNLRNVYEWNGVQLEVDETVYEFGTCYEIECESTEPEKVKAVIEGFLKENEIEYSYSDKSKFATFRSGKL